MLNSLMNLPSLLSIATRWGKGEALLFYNALLIEAGWSTGEILFLLEKTLKVEYWGLLEFTDSWSIYIEKKHYQRVVKALLLSGIPVNLTSEDTPDTPAVETADDRESWFVRLIKKASAL